MCALELKEKKMAITKSTRVHKVDVVPAEPGRLEHALICVTYVDTYTDSEDESATFTRTHGRNFSKYDENGTLTDLSGECDDVRAMAHALWFS